MSEFRDLVARDVFDVFLNPDEFAEEHEIDGQTLMVSVQNIANDHPGMGSHLGAYSEGMVLYIAECDMDALPEGDQIEVDGDIYIVQRWQTEMGMHRVTVSVTATH